MTSKMEIYSIVNEYNFEDSSNQFINQVDSDLQKTQSRKEMHSIQIEAQQNSSGESIDSLIQDPVCMWKELQFIVQKQHDIYLLPLNSLIKGQQDQWANQVDQNRSKETLYKQKKINKDKRQGNYSEIKNIQGDMMKHFKKCLMHILKDSYKIFLRNYSIFEYIMTKKSHNLQDFENLFKIEELRPYIQEIFQNGALKRQVMMGKYQTQSKKKIYIKMIGILYKGFVNKCLLRLKY